MWIRCVVLAGMIGAGAGCIADDAQRWEAGRTARALGMSNGSSLNGSSLNGSSLNGSSLNGSSLNGSSLNGSSLNGSSLNGSSLNGSSLNGVALNGSSLNGSSLNGVTLNGSSLNGSSLNGSSLNGSSLNGSSLNGSSLNGSSLNGSKMNGSSLNGTDFIGARFIGKLSTGGTVNLRIDNIVPLDAPDEDVLFHYVSYETGEGWQPLCGNDTKGNPVPAIPVAGTWDYSEGTPTGGSKRKSTSSFTFACRWGAVAKCVMAGYKPWKTVNGVSLESYHQACTRLIRADYCGDGRSFTVNGRLINLYDGLGVETDDFDWNFEAEWTPKGAACISNLRGRDILGLNDHNLPQCVRERMAASGNCGQTDHFSGRPRGVLLMTEFASYN